MIARRSGRLDQQAGQDKSSWAGGPGGRRAARILLLAVARVRLGGVRRKGPADVRCHLCRKCQALVTRRGHWDTSNDQVLAVRLASVHNTLLILPYRLGELLRVAPAPVHRIQARSRTSAPRLARVFCATASSIYVYVLVK